MTSISTFIVVKENKKFQATLGNKTHIPLTAGRKRENRRRINIPQQGWETSTLTKLPQETSPRIIPTIIAPPHTHTRSNSRE